MRRLQLDQIWESMSELDKTSLYRLTKKAAAQKRTKKTTSRPFSGYLVVFNGMLGLTGNGSSFWKYLGFKEFKTQYNNRCVELLFHPESHFELEKIINHPGSSGKLRLFCYSPKKLYVWVDTQEITSFSKGDGVGLSIRPANRHTWQRLFGKILETNWRKWNRLIRQ